MPKTGMVPAARDAAAKLARDMGYEFIDAELSREHGSVFLRIFIEHDLGIDLARCEAFHKRLLPLVEHLAYDYLEVSSPGIDRKLTSPGDFVRRAGSEVTVKLYRALEGKKEFTGVLIGLEDGAVVLDTPGGRVSFPRRDCALVKPVVEGPRRLKNEEDRQ